MAGRAPAARPRRRRGAALPAVAAAALCPLGALAGPLFAIGQPSPDEGWSPEFAEQFFTIRIRGAAAGLMRSAISVRQTAGGEWEMRSVEEMEAQVDRGADKVILWFSTVTVEDESGAITVAGYTQKMAEDLIRMEYVYPNASAAADAKVQVTSEQVGQVHHSTAPGPGGGYFARIASLRHLGTHIPGAVPGTIEDPATVVEYRTVKPEMGAAVTNVTAILLAAEEKSVTKWHTVVAGIGLNSTERYSQDPETMHGLGEPPAAFPKQLLPSCVLIDYAVDSPFGMLEANLATEEEARHMLATEVKRPELVHSAYVPLKPDQRLSAYYTTPSGEPAQRMVYRMKPKKGSLSDNVPEAGYQAIREYCPKVKGKKKCSNKADEVHVIIDLSNPLPVPESELADREEMYLSATAMIDGTDPAVAELAMEARRDAEGRQYGPPSPDTLARSCHRVAARTIKLSNLATGFASASETARTRQGDCSEYSVLLAAMLRSVGIPSRAASGLVYLDGHAEANFGWHMWSQAILPVPRKVREGEWQGGGDSVLAWVDLDATLPVPFTVGHLLLGTTALTDAGAHSEELKLVSMIGNLQVTVDL